MLYLIKSWGKGGKEYLKVGYTKDWTSREKAYLTHTPEFELLGTREGDTDLESWFRSNFSKYLYRNEWFIFSQEIVDKFLDKSTLNLKEINLRGTEIDTHLKKLLEDFLLPSRGWWIEMGNKYWEQIYKESLEENQGENYGESIKKVYKNLIYNSFRRGQRVIEEWINSLNPREILLSNINIDYLTIDITLDLFQILNLAGDLVDNPWKNSLEIWFEINNTINIIQEEFKKIIDKKIKITNSLLSAYQKADGEFNKHNLAEVYQNMVKYYNYLDNYIFVDRYRETDLTPQVNDLVMISEKRAYDIQQKCYKDSFVIFNKIEEIQNALDNINSHRLFRDKIKCACNLVKERGDSWINFLEDPYRTYIHALGIDFIIANGGEKWILDSAMVQRGMGRIFSKEDLEELVLGYFEVGKKYTKSQIKEDLGRLYKEVGIVSKPKAIDLEKWFELKRATTTIDGKRYEGFEILSRK